MLDWSASEYTDCKDRIMATVACACPDSTTQLSDTWEWRGPCCLVRVHRQMRRCLFTPTWKQSIWQGLTVQPQRIFHVKPQDQSFLSPVIENVKSVELLRPRKVSYPWTRDVSNAFLNAELSEDVVVLSQPAPELIQCGHIKPGTPYEL